MHFAHLTTTMAMALAQLATLALVFAAESVGASSPAAGDPENDDGGLPRRLQAHGRNVDDENICDPSNVALTSVVGTMHDDQVDMMVDCTLSDCSGHGASLNGYGDNLDCSKTITAPENFVVSLLFTQFNLEACPATSSCDYIEIFDGPSTSSASLGQFTGSIDDRLTYSHLPPGAIRSHGRSVTLQFHTDAGNAMIQSSSDPGFYVDWSFIEVLDNQGICTAPGVVSTPYGVLRDDLSSNEGYGDGLDCQVTFLAGRDEQVELSFTQLNLQDGSQAGCGSCAAGGCDHIEVYDGRDERAPLLGHFTGNPAQMPTVVSSSTAMHVRFKTDTGNCNIGGTEAQGFFALWTFLENGQNICQPSTGVFRSMNGVLHDDLVGHVNCDADRTCGGEDSGQTGYGDNLDCGVRIRAPKSSVVNLKFDQLNLEATGKQRLLWLPDRLLRRGR